MTRRPRVIKAPGAPIWSTETRMIAEDRAGRHCVEDAVVVLAEGRAYRGMVLEEKASHIHWLTGRPRSLYAIQVGPEAENGAAVCICRILEEDSSPDPDCRAIHAGTVDLDTVDLHFTWEETQ